MSTSVTLRFYTVMDAMRRMVDFHRIATNQKPKFFRELADMPESTGARLYAQALTHAMADLASNETDEAVGRAKKIVSFCRANGSLDGLESVFLTSLSILSVLGSRSDFKSGLDVLHSLPKIEGLGGGLGSAMYFDASERILSGLSLTAIQGLLNPTDIARSLKADKDPRGQVQRAVDDDAAAGKRCRGYLPVVAGAVGQQVGKKYGPEIGASLGGAMGRAGGVGGALVGGLIGFGVGLTYGEAVGSVAGGVIGYELSELLCGGSTPTTTADNQAPEEPAASPPAAPPTIENSGGTNTTGGPQDDPSDEGDPLDHDDGTMVATPINPNIDRDDPTDRDPEDGGRGPSIAHVARFQSGIQFPDRFLNEATTTSNPNQLSLHMLPKYITLNDGTTIDWGPVSPYIYFTNYDPDTFVKTITDVMNSGRGFVPDPNRPGRVMLNPSVVNPIRDVVREMLSRVRADALKAAGVSSS